MNIKTESRTERGRKKRQQPEYLEKENEKIVKEGLKDESTPKGKKGSGGRLAGRGINGEKKSARPEGRRLSKKKFRPKRNKKC